MPTPKVYDFNPYHLPSDILHAIGIAVAAYAQTESIIEMAITGCLGVEPDYGLAATTHMSAPLRDIVLRSAAEIRIDDLDALEELDTILDHIKDVVQPKRNAIAHNTWCRDPDTDEVFTVKQTARGSVDMQLIPMSADGIKSDALIIYKAGMSLMAFINERGLMPTFPPKPRPRAHKTKTARKERRKKLLAAAKAKS